MAISRLRNNNTGLTDAHNLRGRTFRGRVEDNNDPRSLGRVKVRVPMIHGTENNGVSLQGLPWARVTGQSAGFGYGTLIIPEVGEYVSVTFEDGSLYKPIVTGSLYGSGSKYGGKPYGSGTEGDPKWTSPAGVPEAPTNGTGTSTIGADGTPEPQAVLPTQKILYKGTSGAYISLDEYAHREEVILHDALGQEVRLNAHLSNSPKVDGGAPEPSNDSGIQITSTKGNKIELRATGEISMSYNGGEVMIDTNGQVHIKAGTLNLSSSGHVTISGDGVTIGAPVTLLE